MFSSNLSAMFRAIAPLALSVAVIGASASPAAAEATIQPGDKLALKVFNHPDLSEEETVTGDGQIRVPIAGSVAVEGLSEQAAQSRIESALSSYLYHPSVDVRVVSSSQSIFFTGSLVGAQPFTPGETLGSAIGGFRQTLSAQAANSSVSMARLSSVDLRQVRVAHGKSTTPPIDLEQLSRDGESGPRLEPGDVVLLSAKPIRVDVRGNTSAPLDVYVYPGDTLAQAVAEAGPISPTTSLSSIGLKRDGTDSVVSAAGSVFKGPAHDGDVVTLEPAPRVAVLGMVEKAGDTTLQTRPTLLNALYEAGGPNRYADLSHIKLTHEGETKTIDVSRLAHGDLSQNVTVDDGDVIFVPEGHKIDFMNFTSVITTLASLKVFGIF